MRAGAQIYENSPVSGIERGAPKRLHVAGGHIVKARIVMLCGNAYLADVGLPQMTRRLAGGLVRSGDKAVVRKSRPPDFADRRGCR